MGGHLDPISAEPHAAPLAGMVFRRIIKIQDTGVIAALPDKGQIGSAEQVAGGVC